MWGQETTVTFQSELYVVFKTEIQAELLGAFVFQLSPRPEDVTSMSLYVLPAAAVAVSHLAALTAVGLKNN